MNNDGTRGRTPESVSTAEEQAAPPAATSGYQSAAPVPQVLKCRRCGRKAATEMYCAHCYVLTRYAEGEEPPWLNDVLRAVEAMECALLAKLGETKP